MITRKLTSWFVGVLCMLAVLTPVDVRAQKKLNVVTTIPVLASITEFIGGEHVSVFPIASGFQNPHFVDPKPSYITRLARADMFVTVGLDLETGWVPALLNSSRNGDVMSGGAGYVDASSGIDLLQIPTNVSRDQGDIHIYGNPHYWLDPIRGKAIAHNIHDALVKLMPTAHTDFDRGLANFESRIDEMVASFASSIEALRGTKVVAYHNEWPYLEEFLGIEIVDFLEPKPGIPPSASQLAKVIATMENQHVQVIITSPYFKSDNADLVARKVGGKVVVLATSVGAFEGIDSYFDLFEYNVHALMEAVER